MIKIKTKADIGRLKDKKQYSKDFILYLEAYYKELWESLGDEEAIEEFSLEDHGYIVILEETDNIQDLSEVGLSKKDEGLLGVIPEWIELKEFEDGSSYYEILILYNNEYAMIFYLTEVIVKKNQKLEDWIQKNIEP